MSDMSRPRPLPPAADHERHDALLVAQSAAGDPLSDEERAEAQRLVGSCGACAALVADLRAVSMAVARERVPPRRRDFRLSPEQAEQLSGNALSRFLRGLSLPAARAFQPAAAGVLSIGLIFVVAGYAWPDEGSISVQAEPNFATYEVTTPAPAPAEAPAAPVIVGQGLDEAADVDEVESLMADPDFAETLPEHQAGTSERANQKSVADEVDRPPADAAELELAEPVAPLASPSDEGRALAEILDADALESAALGAMPADGLAAEERADDLMTEYSAGAQEPKAETPGETSAASVTTRSLVDDSGPEELLMILGLLLVLGGGGLLLLGWLVRRSRDPLLR